MRDRSIPRRLDSPSPDTTKPNFWNWAPPTTLAPGATMSGLGIGAFVVAVIPAWGILGIILGLGACTMGRIAMHQARTHGQRGYGLAFAAYVIGAVRVMVPILILLAVLLITVIYHLVHGG